MGIACRILTVKNSDKGPVQGLRLAVIPGYRYGQESRLAFNPVDRRKIQR